MKRVSRSTVFLSAWLCAAVWLATGWPAVAQVAITPQGTGAPAVPDALANLPPPDPVPAAPAAVPGASPVGSAPAGAVPPAVPPPPVVAPPSAASPPAPVVDEPEPYAVPGADTLQEAARLNGIIAKETIEIKLEALRQDRERQKLKYEADVAKVKAEREEIENGGRKKSRAQDEAPPKAYVNSIYRFGDQAFAEVLIGSNKVVAQRGTVLINGDRVVSIGETAVTVRGRGGVAVLPVRGSAGQSDIPAVPAFAAPPAAVPPIPPSVPDPVRVQSPAPSGDAAAGER